MDPFASLPITTDSTAASVPATDASASSTTSSVSFKKRTNKRKEFRAPAASLTTQDGGSVAAAASAVSAPPVAATPAAAASSAVTISEGKPNSDDDDDDETPQVASTSALLAQAAEVDTDSGGEEPDDDKTDTPVIDRPTKRQKKENPLLVASTLRNKLKKEYNLHIASTRSATRDTTSIADQVTTIVDAETFNRDPNKPKWSGPAKPMASNVRMISRMDYQPDVCKDYKETGRCGYGDSCKFLHEREDYKQSWQLDADWNKQQEKRQKRILAGLNPDEEEKSDKPSAEELPWACSICRQAFVKPVVTKCNHYFCEKCALDNYLKDTKCAVCKTQTNGIFNTATDLIRVIKQRATQGIDPRKEIEMREEKRKAEKAALAQGDKWQLPGRTAGL